MSNYRSIKIIILITTALFLAACGGKSNISGEIVPIGKVCSYTKAKVIAVEGFIEPKSMNCKKTSKKKSSGILGCSFKIYADSDSESIGIPVFIYTNNLMSGKNNRMEEPDINAMTDIVFQNRNGNPISKKPVQIFDNDGNLIPISSKIRVYGELNNSENCQIEMAKRIEKIS